MKFALATLYVKDMDKSLAFYNGLLEIPIIRRQSAGPGEELVFLGVDKESNLELISAPDMGTYSGFSIGFEVEDLEKIKVRLKSNGYPIKREISPSPSLQLCFLDGPNGEEVELIQYQ